ncbi:hypothetical protein FQA39_LY06482 [Lamprigera yunnana]|nr:hypothetical protein FQA39_LY06482 [Lamprigera yunnana]
MCVFFYIYSFCIGIDKSYSIFRRKPWLTSKFCSKGATCLSDNENTDTERSISEIGSDTESRSTRLSNKQVFEQGTVVWAKFGKKWWAAMVIQNPEDTQKNKYNVFWLSDYSTSLTHIKNVTDFVKDFKTVIKIFPRMSKLWKKGVFTALKELYCNKFNFGIEHIEELSENGLNNVPYRENVVPQWIQEILKDPKSYSSISNNKRTCRNKSVSPGRKICHDRKIGSEYIREIIKDNTRNAEILRHLCLGCYTTRDANYNHPLFNAQICSKCLSNLKYAMIRIGDGGIHEYCGICGSARDLLVCNNSCRRAYCKECLSNFIEITVWEEFSKKWICFICDDSNSPIRKRNDSTLRTYELYSSQEYKLVKVPEGPLETGTHLRVLSLFDGISTGLYTLDQLNVPIEVYYASEIDEAAINVSKMNFSNKVRYIGDVKNITEPFIEKISPIHLLIGGSPCNDLSLVNPARKGLFDDQGTGMLFFEFYRVLLLLKKYNQDGFYWLYENVASMELSTKETISRYLQCKGALKDASMVSAQHRPRLFWGNLATLPYSITEKEVDLQMHISLGRVANVTKLNTVTTNSNSLRQGKYGDYPVTTANNQEDIIWVTELERVFGLPTHYTDTGNLNTAKRLQLLGKAWSIPVMMHLFSILTYFCSPLSTKSN